MNLARKRFEEEPSTPEQRRMIGYLRKILCIGADTYYEMIWNSYGVESSKDLNMNQAARLLTELKAKAIALGKWQPRSKYAFKKTKYNDLQDRDKYAPTPKQLRMIDAMWTDVSRQTNDIKRADAFNKFLQRITGKPGVRFLVKSDIQKVVKALEKMKESTPHPNPLPQDEGMD